MTAEEFWHGDPNLVIAFRKADKLRWERFNTEAWLLGRYNYVAVATALNNGFSKKKIDYPKQPADLFEKSEEEQKIEEQKAREQVYAQLQAMVAQQQRDKMNGKHS